MRLLKKHRDARWHYVDGESAETLCGQETAALRREWQSEEPPTYGICTRCDNKLNPKPKPPKLTVADMKAICARASEAAVEAFTAAKPPTMVVGTPKNLMGSLTGGDDGGLDPDEPIYVVPEGPCGFGWVTVRPGGSRFARFLIKEKIGSPDSYAGGVTIWYSKLGVPDTQSYERNYAAARAYADVLREAGIAASAGGSLD